jgi:hypothetical protein
MEKRTLALDRDCAERKRRYVALMKRFLTLTSLLALFLTACATTKIDWQSRVGNYSYDQAVLEFGPPDKDATLKDGTRVAEWLTSHGRARPGMATYLGGGLVHVSNDVGPDYYLRLTFAPSGQLQSFRKYAK